MRIQQRCGFSSLRNGYLAATPAQPPAPGPLLVSQSKATANRWSHGFRGPLLVLVVYLLGSLHGTEGLCEPRLLVASSSNFSQALGQLAKRFEAQTGIEVDLVFGSTGKLYAQIVHGAPFDVFLAADIERPQKLVRQGLGFEESCFTYALGRLVLYTSSEALGASLGADTLTSMDFERLSIANPQHAPYGQAARQVLDRFKLWPRLTGRVVHGENVAQAFQFVDSGHVELGLIAWSIVKAGLRSGSEGQFWMVPEQWHRPLEQQAVLLRRTDAGERFLRFLQGPESTAVISSFGYGVP